MKLGGFQPLMNQVNVSLCRLDASRRFLLEAMQHINRLCKTNRVDRAGGVVFAWGTEIARQNLICYDIYSKLSIKDVGKVPI